MSTDLATKKQTFEHQPDAVLDQENPVSEQKYTVLDTTKNVRIIGTTAKCTWTVQPTPLKLYITIDGRTETFNQVDPVSLTAYKAMLNPRSESNAFTTVSTDQVAKAFLIEGRSVKVEVSVTNGTVSNLSARVKWAKK